MIARTSLLVFGLGAALTPACKGRDPRRGLDREESSESYRAAPSLATSSRSTTAEAGSAASAQMDLDGKFAAEPAKDEQNAPQSSRASSPVGHGSGAGAGFGAAAGKRDRAKAKESNAEDGLLGGEAAATPTRSWFPETFLFQPLVVTSAGGEATVAVTVPDRLTTWRVLALAHSRSGAQGGAVTSFLGTLPVYVDPVVPGALVMGDEVRIPVQAVNTTSAPVSAQLAVSATGARLVGGSGSTTIAAGGTAITYATLTVTRPGHLEVRAAINGTDAVIRGIDVVPAGKPEVIARSGTLASARTLTITGPVGSDPASDRVRLQVFPGALALLRAELGVSLARSGAADDAYALLLAGRAPALLAALGDTADPKALRDLTIIAGQRIVREARTFDVATASVVAEATLAHGQNPVLAGIGERAVAYLVAQQRPDGSFAGGDGWTLQRLLVATADATRAVAASHGTVAQQQRAAGVRLKAAGAFTRNAAQVMDGYTAAVMLASGAVDGPLTDVLRERVRAAITEGSDSAKYLTVEPGVVRADGVAPSRVEATALAVLALAGDPKAAAAGVADLGGTLLAGYDPSRGWGDGRANLACMLAVLQLFEAPVPASVAITLTRDGQPVVRGTFDRAALKDVLVLTADAPAATAAPWLGGSHVWKVVAEPAVAGLGFSLALEGYTPWATQSAAAGLELGLPAAMTGRVGSPIDVAVTAVAPGGMALHVIQALPAGVQVDTPSLEKLVAAGTIQRFETADGRVELFVAGLAPGAVFAATYRVIPTLAGTLHGAASSIEAGGHIHHVAPTTWTIKG